jgi:hypothetical protein
MARVNPSTTITGEGGSVLDDYDAEAVTAAQLGVTTRVKDAGGRSGEIRIAAAVAAVHITALAHRSRGFSLAI